MANNQESSIEIIAQIATVAANAAVQAILEEEMKMKLPDAEVTQEAWDLGEMDSHHCTPMQIR